MFYSHRNRFFVIIKNFPLKLLIEGIYRLFLNYFYSLESIFVKKGYSARTREKIGMVSMIHAIVKGWIIFFIFLPKMLRKRFYIQNKKTIRNEKISEWFKRYGEGKNMAKEEYIK